LEFIGQLHAAATLLSCQKATEHEAVGLLNSGVMGVCHMEHIMGICHYTGKMCNVAVTQVTVYLHSLSKTEGLKLNLEFLDICMTNISDTVTRNLPLDNAVD
jgi:hypothetical protein